MEPLLPITRFHETVAGQCARDPGARRAQGDTAGGREALRQALVLANTEYVREDLIANSFMRLGDRESAIQWMVNGDASNVGGIVFSLEDPLFAPIRSDSRIQAIMARLKVQ